MPNKSIPTIGDPNWGTPLNAHLSQLQNPTNGGINTFEQFSGRPTNLTADDKGKTYLYTQTGNLHQWTGTIWKVLNESVINVKDYGAVGDGVADDSDAIIKSIQFNSTTFFPSGKYLITKQIGLNVDPIGFHRKAPKIIGGGPLSTVFVNKVKNGSLFSYQQFSNQYFYFGYGLEFRDFGIIGEDASIVNSNGISVSGAVNPIFSNIRIRALTGHGITLPFDMSGPVEGTAPNQYVNADSFSCFYPKFDYCAIELCGKWGFYIEGSGNSITMNNSYVSSCAGGGMYNISAGNIVDNCSFSYCGNLNDPKSGGLQFGDDFSSRPDLMRNGLPQTNNNHIRNIELDSNYNFNLTMTGYFNTVSNVRLLQNSLPVANGQLTFDAPVFVRCGMPNAALFSTTFTNIIIRVSSHTAPGNPNNLTGIVFGEYNGSSAYNIRFKNVFNLFDQPGSFAYNGITYLGLTYYNFANQYSYNILSEDIFGSIIYKKSANGYATTIPTTGNNTIGKFVYNENPTPGGYTGWICTAAGTPGTWKGFGLIEV
jgi:Pectate lyase superfamily protein